jgi:hypothetical protein
MVHVYQNMWEYVLTITYTWYSAFVGINKSKRLQMQEIKQLQNNRLCSSHRVKAQFTHIHTDFLVYIILSL